jgi:hypothetical protein
LHPLRRRIHIEGTAMQTKFNLDYLQVATPCEMSWDAMRGNEKARYCDSCHKHVYNFAAMTTEEGLALITQTEGEFCGRLTMRSDGMLMTADCPVGVAAKLTRFRRRLVYTVVATAFMLVGFIQMRQPKGSSSSEASVDGLPVIANHVQGWLDQLREWAGLQSRRSVTVMGGCPGPPPMMGKVMAPPSSK